MFCFGVCGVVVWCVCCCCDGCLCVLPAAFVCFVCDCLLLLLCDGVCCCGDDCVCGFLLGLWCHVVRWVVYICRYLFGFGVVCGPVLRMSSLILSLWLVFRLMSRYVFPDPRVSLFSFLLSVISSSSMW